MERTIDFSSIDGTCLQGTLTIPNRVRGMLVLAHGITSTRDEWGIFAALASAAERISVASFRFDYRCHGYSDLPFTDFSLHGVLSDVDAAWNAVSADARLSTILENVPLFACGSSFGGGILYRWASLQSKVRKAFLLAPVFDYYADITKTASNWAEDLSSTDKIDYAGNQLSRAIITEAKYFAAIPPGGRNLPALIIHGTSDDDVPIEMSRRVVETTSHLQLLPIENAGHVLAVPGDLDMVDPQSWKYVQFAQEAILESISAALSE